MAGLIQIDLNMNAYLFGSLILMALWGATLIALKIFGARGQIPEFWWASAACGSFGITEPLFVPEYWEPLSIFKIWRWDLESFIFCFAVGGIASVLTEIPMVKRFMKRLTSLVEQAPKSFFSLISRATGKRINFTYFENTAPMPPVSKDLTRVENMVLVTFFVGMFGATSHFNLNIIYDVAIVCVAAAIFIAWRRPGLRWQALGGGISFTVIYTLVLLITGLAYPSFYDQWNLKALTGLWIWGAPFEEYLFSFSFGFFWAPLYETWKGEIPPPPIATARSPGD